MIKKSTYFIKILQKNLYTNKLIIRKGILRV
jgi:hypothetical protein